MVKVLLRCLSVSALLLGTAALAPAAPIYLTYSSSGASGDIDGEVFSDASWLIEFEVEQLTADASPEDPLTGFFEHAILGGHVRINGNDYSLAGASTTGSVIFFHSPGEFDSAIVTLASGGQANLTADFGAIFPALFTDFKDLGTANFGTTVFDTPPDPFEFGSGLLFSGCEDIETEVAQPCLFTTTGTINISQMFEAGSGDLSLSLSEESTFEDANAVPEPGTWLMMATGLAVVGRRIVRARKRRT